MWNSDRWKEINYMNLPGWNEQPDSDELSVQNKQLRHCYKTVLFKFSTNSGIYKKK